MNVVSQLRGIMNVSMTHSINYGSEVSVMYFKNESVVNL